jgi:hypothetical protein
MSRGIEGCSPSIHVAYLGVRQQHVRVAICKVIIHKAHGDYLIFIDKLVVDPVVLHGSAVMHTHSMIVGPCTWLGWNRN